MLSSWESSPEQMTPDRCPPTPQQWNLRAEWFGDRALTIDELLRCREQALYCAAMMCDSSPFPEDDAKEVLLRAKLFNVWLVTGEMPDFGGHG